MAVANKPEDDTALQRKLWLAIARHLVQSACSSDGADSAVCPCPSGLALLRRSLVGGCQWPCRAVRSPTSLCVPVPCKPSVS